MRNDAIEIQYMSDDVMKVQYTHNDVIITTSLRSNICAMTS